MGARSSGSMEDRSNGYERVAAEFLAGRGSPQSSGIGARQVRDWARRLRRSSTVLELGCGTGLPITQALVEEGLEVCAVDAAPTLVAAFKRNFPGVPVACEPAESSTFFDRQFDAVLAWGLLFLLTPADQRTLLARMAEVLKPGGRLLFTSPPEPIAWNDAMTGLRSQSLGRSEYVRLLEAAGVTVEMEYEDVGENHYYDAVKTGGT
jgi:SAM-dependent methyltransferase